jgi:hypothetical protein
MEEIDEPTEYPVVGRESGDIDELWLFVIGTAENGEG